MLRQLIQLAVCAMLTAPAVVSAQTPIAAKANTPVKPEPLPAGFSPDAACNEAGTFTLGAFTGQSNDHDLSTPASIIYLCLGDQIFIDHNGDFDLSGDPNTGTAAGVSYAFYNCKPTVGGMTLANVVADPCINAGGSPPPTQGLWLAQLTTATEAQGDILFKNTGALQTFFNGGNPLLQWFAPITVDDWLTLGYENSGSCVDVSPQVAFPVVYLNEVEVTDITTGLGVGGCIGRFHPEGGFSEYIDLTSTGTSPYQLSFAGPGQVVVATKPSDIRHGGLDPSLMFSAPGIYTITVIDQKSCAKSFTMDMSGCNPADNVTIISGNANAQVNQTVCVPISVDNFTDIASLQGTINWCPQNFEFVSITAGALPNADVFYNQNDIANGNLGFAWFDPNGAPLTLVNGTTIFEVCLQATGQVGDCCPVSFTNTLTSIAAGDENFQQLAVITDEGTVCIGQPSLDAEVTVLTNCTSAGSFQVEINSGTPNYEMSYFDTNAGPGSAVMVDFAASYTVTNLSPGTYEIHIEDANGVKYDTSITIFSLSVNLAFTDVSCFNGMDGTATVTASPASTYDYTWNPVLPNSPMQTNLAKGTYIVTVTHPASGCTAIASGSLGSPQAIQKSMLMITDATCTGIPNGSVSFNIIGGTPGYTINFAANSGLGSSSGATYNNPAIKSGNYIFTITDSKGCSKVDSFEVNAQKEYVLDLAITDVKCFGQNTGSIVATLTTFPGAPTAPVNYIWSNGGNTSTVNNLNAGPIGVTVTDATGCGVQLDTAVGGPPTAFTTVIVGTQPTCSGPSSGAVQALGTTGGILPYTFAWTKDGVAMPQTGPSQNNLVPGTYCVTATDANGCTATDCETLSIPQPPIIQTVDSVSVSCSNSTDGQLTVNAILGQPNSGPLTYKWQGSTSTTNVASGLACGAYNVTVTDFGGCSTVGSWTLACPPALVFVDTVIAQPTCPGFDNGSVCVTVNGGIGNYTYAWQNNPTALTNCLNNKKAGTYNLTVKDANGCSLLGAFQIKDPIGISANFSNLQDASCANQTACDGSVMVTASYPGGLPATFTYEWLEANVFGQNPTTLCPGTNTVKITDNATGCFIEATIPISAPPPLVIENTVPLPTSCNGACDASLASNVTGGVTPYTYSWSNGQSTPQATGLCAGPIVLTVTDANGCESTNIFANVPEPAPVDVFFDPAVSTNVLCFGGSNGTLGWLATGGTPAYSWTWSPNVSNQQVQNNLPAGQYSVTATDAKGCTGTATANLQENPPIVASFDSYLPIKCFGETTNLSVDTVTGGVGPYNYEIDYGPTTPSGIDTRIEGGDHIAIFIDASDCRDTVFFTIDQPAEIGLNLGPDLRIELGDTTQQIFPQFNIQVDSFVWFPTVGLDSATDLRPFINTFESKLYTLTIFDANGCSGTDELYVEIDPNRKVYIPNIFKPGSSLSDHFRVFVGNGVKSINYMRIFDRWGEMVFEEEKFFPSNGDYSEGWDGMYRGKRVNPGVYVYIIEVSFLDGRTLLYRGDVTLVRDKE